MAVDGVDAGEEELRAAQERQRALIRETQPVLHSLEQQLRGAREFLTRLEQARKDAP